MFGGEIDAGLVGGILHLDADFNIIGTSSTTRRRSHQRVFFLGLQGGFSMAGMAGFTIRVGLSELGPLSAFINVEMPGGILLEPITGLTINDFSAGVEFFKTLPSIDDPFALRGERLPAADGADRRRVAERPPAPGRAQAKAISRQPGAERLHGRVHRADDDHRLARRSTRSTPPRHVFNGQVIVKISTDGKFLIVGKLNFAADNISISGRLYADLSKIASGEATVLFLADVPDQVRLLTIYGKLKMGFRNATGEEVVFDVLDVPATQPGSTKPTATIVNPATAGGSSAVTDRAELLRRPVHRAQGRRARPGLDPADGHQDHAAPRRDAVQLHRHHADVADRGRRRAGLRPAAPRRQRHPARRPRSSPSAAPTPRPATCRPPPRTTS